MKGEVVSLTIGDEESVSSYFGDNMNMLVVGPPGCGKTFSVVSPNIVNNNGCSMFIDDKKGNLYHKHKEELKASGYLVLCFNLINFYGDMHYNPLESIKCRDDIFKFANILIPEEKTASDPFWVDSARELLIIIVEILLNDEKTVNLKSVIELLHKTQFRVDRVRRKMKDEVDKIIDRHRAEGKSYVSMDRYSSFKECAEDTWNCIRRACISALSAYDSDRLYSITDKNTFDITKMGMEKVALFVTSSDTNGAFDAIVQLMYREFSEKLIEYADIDRVDYGSMLQQHVRFILDDFASGVRMKGFEKVIANCRSRNISFVICIQSLSQLQGLYGEMSNSILDCINYRIYFSTTNLSTQNYLSTIMDIPLSDVQNMQPDEIVIEQKNRSPRFGRRYSFR